MDWKNNCLATMRKTRNRWTLFHKLADTLPILIRLRLIQTSVRNAQRPLQAIPSPDKHLPDVETVGIAENISGVYRTGPWPEADRILRCVPYVQRGQRQRSGCEVEKQESVRGPSKPWTADCSSGNLTPAKKKKENSLTTNREM
jgi:hypothetical protein